MITYNISNLFRENTNNNCKNGKEAHNETIRAYGAMGFLKLDYEIKLKIAVGRNTIFIKKTKECTHTHPQIYPQKYKSLSTSKNLTLLTIKKKSFEVFGKLSSRSR